MYQRRRGCDGGDLRLTKQRGSAIEGSLLFGYDKRLAQVLILTENPWRFMSKSVCHCMEHRA